MCWYLCGRDRLCRPGGRAQTGRAQAARLGALGGCGTLRRWQRAGVAVAGPISILIFPFSRSAVARRRKPGEIQLLTARGAFMTAELDRGSVVAVKGKWTTSWDIPEWFYR